MSNDPLAWRVLSTQNAFENRWTGVHVDEVELPNGERYDYTRIRPAGVGVAVVAINQHGQILLEREYRHGLGEVIWQLPGGLVDEGESLTDAGLRELAEETGYAPTILDESTVRYLGCVWDNPGLGPAESHVVGVWHVEASRETSLESTEFITLHWVASDWLKESVRSGEIRERTTVAATAYLLLNGYL